MKPETKFGIIWGVVGFLLATYLVSLLQLIERITSILLQILIWIILLPAKLLGYIPSDNKILLFGLAIAIGLLLGPYFYKIVKIIIDVLKKSPI